MSKFLLFTLFVFCGSLSHLLAADGHEHKHDDHHHVKKVAGPNGGKVFHHHAFDYEFFVKEDKYIQLTFLDQKGKPKDLTFKTVDIICGDRLNPTSISFTKHGKTFLSNKPLPASKNQPAIITLVDQQGKTLRNRLQVNLSDCGGCDYKEYACTCDH